MIIVIIKALAYLCQIAVLILPVIMVWKNRKPQYRQLQELYIKTLPFYLLGILIIWLLIQLAVYFTNAYLQAELNVFDLDGNDVFSSEEYSEDQAAAMHRVIADTGRALAPITGAIFAVGYMSLLMLMAGLQNIFTRDEPVNES